jgi:NADPH-dependent ferric siderophore reductase
MQKHETQRLRHEMRKRTITVDAIEQITPSMLRIDFICADFADFASASPDDHIKLVFPLGSEVGERPCMRDFTPRRFDAARGTLTIDFVIHLAGPATEWATGARVGNSLDIGGPKGSAVVPDDFDWYLLIGDETALPAIGRRLEELRAGVPVTSLVLLSDPVDAQQVSTRALWTPRWIMRRPGVEDLDTMREALADLPLPAGEGFVWIAAENSIALGIRSHVIDHLGHPKEWTKAIAYWTKEGCE